MPHTFATNFDLVRAAYAAFNTRDIDGAVLADELVWHRFTVTGGLIDQMEVVEH